MLLKSGPERWAGRRVWVAALALTFMTALLVLFGLFPGEALAHSSLAGANPQPGARLSEGPARIELQFTEKLEEAFTRIQVQNAQGEMVQTGPSRVISADGRVVGVDLPPLSTGVYTVVYAVTPGDGHTISGRYSFGVGPLDQTVESAVQVSERPVAMGEGLGKGIFLATTLALAGLLLFLQIVWIPVVGPNSNFHNRLRWVGLALAVGVAISGFWTLRAFAATAAGASFDLVALGQAAAGTVVGRLTLIRILVAAATAGLLWPSGRRPGTLRWAGLSLSLLLVLLTGLQGHAADMGSPMALISAWAHLGAAAAWAGGLLGFLCLMGPYLRSLPEEQKAAVRSAAVRRFTVVAVGSIAVLALTGTYAALLQIPDLQALAETAYGRALSGKVTLLVVALALGAVHALLRGGRWFHVTIVVEATLALAVFGAVGYLSSSPPSRVVRAAQEEARKMAAVTTPFKLQSFWPGTGELLRSAPPGVDVRFNRALDPDRSSLTLMTAEGKPVPTAPAQINADEGWIWLETAGLPEGPYMAHWAATSDDGQVLQGSWSFSLPGSAPAASGTDPTLFAVGLLLSLGLGLGALLVIYALRGQLTGARGTVLLALLVAIGLAAVTVGTAAGEAEGLHPIALTLPTVVEPAGETAVVTVEFPRPLFLNSGLRLVDDKGARVHPGNGAPARGDRSVWELRVPALRPGSYWLEWDVVSDWTGQRARGAYPLHVRDVRDEGAASDSSAHAGHTAEAVKEVHEGTPAPPPRVHTPQSTRVFRERLAPYRIEASAPGYGHAFLTWLEITAAALLAGGAAVAWTQTEHRQPSNPRGRSSARRPERQGGSALPRWAPWAFLAALLIDLVRTWVVFHTPAFEGVGSPAVAGPWLSLYGAAWLVLFASAVGILIFHGQRSTATVLVLAVGALLVRGAFSPLGFGGAASSILFTQLILVGSAGMVWASGIWGRLSGWLAERRLEREVVPLKG